MNQPEPPFAATVATHSHAAFESVIEAHILKNGYVPVAREGFDRERTGSPETVPTVIHGTQPKECANPESLHGERTGEQILSDLFKWMDRNGSLATLRHGFKCHRRRLNAAFVGICSNKFDARSNHQARPGGRQ
jgi:type I restriction enzyme R subunit